MAWRFQHVCRYSSAEVITKGRSIIYSLNHYTCKSVVKMMTPKPTERLLLMKFLQMLKFEIIAPEAMTTTSTGGSSGRPVYKVRSNLQPTFHVLAHIGQMRRSSNL